MKVLRSSKISTYRSKNITSFMPACNIVSDDSVHYILLWGQLVTVVRPLCRLNMVSLLRWLDGSPSFYSKVGHKERSQPLENKKKDNKKKKEKQLDTCLADTKLCCLSSFSLERMPLYIHMLILQQRDFLLFTIIKGNLYLSFPCHSLETCLLAILL